MHPDSLKLLQLMFRDGESMCVSHNAYAYHSIPMDSLLSGQVTMVSSNPDVAHQKVSTDRLIFVALNPIQGFRNDANSTAFRNFLVELDAGAIDQQIAYIKTMGLPYSAIVFSGNKSAHVLISLVQDLPNEEMYRLFAEWTLKALPLADPDTKNPSRSIRLPGVIRPDTGRLQDLLEFKGPVDLKDMSAWLAKHEDARPKKKERKERSANASYERLAPWVKTALTEGLDPTKGRNKQWFAISCEFALCGYNLSDTLDILGKIFVPERDFSEKEWEIAIESGHNHMLNRKS